MAFGVSNELAAFLAGLWFQRGSWQPADITKESPAPTINDGDDWWMCPTEVTVHDPVATSDPNAARHGDTAVRAGPDPETVESWLRAIARGQN